MKRRMLMRIRWIVPYLFTLVLVGLGGCASGSVIVTGSKRKPVPAEDVALLLEPPAEFETIGLVSASSDSGFTEQGSVDYAVKKLKKLAAKLGANGVLLASMDERTTTAVGGNGSGYFYAVTGKSKIVQGKAIYVKSKAPGSNHAQERTAASEE
jgi:hypothetical protein